MFSNLFFLDFEVFVKRWICVHRISLALFTPVGHIDFFVKVLQSIAQRPCWFFRKQLD